MKNYKFSLILCTIGRTDYVESFIHSLSEQAYKKFELIIVDQNDDERISELLARHQDNIELTHIKSERGLSKSRNTGMKYISGDIVAFPDDDCIYPVELLHHVNEFFSTNDPDVLTIKMTNSIPTGRKVQANTKSQPIHKYNVLRLMASISAFYKKEVVDSVGEFDERLGLGTHTIFQGGEDYDYPLRALEKEFVIYYTNKIEVLHPWDDDTIDKTKDLTGRSYKGGATEMFLLNKHNFSVLYRCRRIIRRIMIIGYYSSKRNRYKAMLSIAILRGMIAYFRYRPG